MVRITLALITCSVFTGCMTQADKALWSEAKQTFSGKKTETVTAEAPAEAAPAAADLKTSKDTKDKDEAPAVKDEGLVKPKTKAN